MWDEKCRLLYKEYLEADSPDTIHSSMSALTDLLDKNGMNTGLTQSVMSILLTLQKKLEDCKMPNRHCFC